MKYSPLDKPIDVQLTSQDNHVLLEIIDQGTGVPNNQLEKIFNPFYRVDTSRTKKTGGYGLGLSIAQQVIQRHEGRIEAVNQPEGGLKVSIYLPK
jgi:two-component system sensor histidine kinase CpxA